jgi:hypothetical protein
MPKDPFLEVQSTDKQYSRSRLLDRHPRYRPKIAKSLSELRQPDPRQSKGDLRRGRAQQTKVRCSLRSHATYPQGLRIAGS